MPSNVIGKTLNQYRFFQNKVVRFFLSAGVAMLVDVTIYFITFNFIFVKDVVMIFGHPNKAHNVSLLISYSCGVIVNFLLTKYAVFANSTLASRRQFIRFSFIAFIGFFANYALLRFFIEIFYIAPTLARIISALSLGFSSYYVHKLFTFKIKPNND
ncbi:GtrA family protein [Pedobacter sp. SD-b]|uniref:GtrA family protein n=1 Tax=Pedobacter segetis TaxID=2793069 RepID=A0ABS1BFG9_9SPHI|nr:GtrA family protein [Pedobacter segetis]MBK0381599.1 GtrA family protein [Pedobacter segetis]